MKKTIVIAIYIVMVISVIRLNHSRLSRSIIDHAVIQFAAQSIENIEVFRALYTSEVVKKAEDFGMEITHDYANKKGAIPLPATLSMHIGDAIGSGQYEMDFRLYSEYPFPWRKDGGPIDAFETEALAWLKNNPGQAFIRFENIGGHNILRYAAADLMRPDCVSCHNSHPDSQKMDWKEGDLRGVLEVTVHTDDLIAEANRGLWMTTLLLIALGTVGVFLLIYAFNKMRLSQLILEKMNKDLEGRVKERTIELHKANHTMKEDLVLARRFQQTVLPEIMEVPFLKIALRYIPFAEVSGDIYDFTYNEEGQLAVFIGDATGHGVSAALMTMMLHTGLDSIKGDMSTNEVLNHLNSLLAARESEMSATGIQFKITAEGCLKASNAGHPPLIILPADKQSPILIKSSGTAMGWFTEAPFEFVEESYQLENEDRIFVFTDGITEWLNPEKDFYGSERLIKYIEDYRYVDLEQLIDGLIEEVEGFAKGNRCNDDVTILAFEFQKPALEQG